MPKHETPNILLNNMGSKHSLLNDVWPVYVILQKKKFHQKHSTKLFCVQRIKHNFYWKKKQPTYIRYVIANLSKFAQISLLTSS